MAYFLQYFTQRMRKGCPRDPTPSRLCNFESLYPSLLLWAFVVGLPLSFSAEAQDVQHGLAQILSPKTAIPIDRIPDVRYGPGDSLPIFQQNDDYFVAVIDRVESKVTLAAFPRTQRNGDATGWVTDQNVLMFARPVESTKGEVVLQKGENLPVLLLGKKESFVRVERFGFTADLPIRNKTRGLLLRETEPRRIGEQKPTRTVKRITLADLEGPAPDEDLDIHSVNIESVEAALQEKKNPVSTWVKKVTKSFVADAKSGQAPEPESETGSNPGVFLPEQAYEVVPGTSDMAKLFVNQLYSQRNFSMFGLIATIGLASLYIRRQNKLMREMADSLKQNAIQQTPTPAPPEKTEPAPKVKAKARTIEQAMQSAEDTFSGSTNTGVFSGSLDVFNIRDLINFLHASGSSGVLNIDSPQSADPGRAILKEGEFVHATFDGAMGWDAFIKLCSLDSGDFRFQQKADMKTQTTLDMPTEKLVNDVFIILDKQREKKIIQFGDAS